MDAAYLVISWCHRTARLNVRPAYLVQFGEQSVQAGELAAEVDVSVEAGAGVVESVGVGDLLQESLHAAPLALHKVVHEEHVLFFGAEPETGACALQRSGGGGGAAANGGSAEWTLLAKVGQRLDDFRDESQRASRALVRVSLRQVKERR